MVLERHPLSGLDLKDADGAWEISASDLVGGDTGTLVDWALAIELGTTEDQCSSAAGLATCPACTGGTTSDKVLVCHMTGSKTDPHHTILISPSSVGSHIGDETHAPHCNSWTEECDYLGECRDPE